MSTMYEDVDMENPDGVSGDGSDVCDGLIGVVVNCLSLSFCRFRCNRGSKGSR